MKILKSTRFQRISKRLINLRSGKVRKFFLLNIDYPDRKKSSDEYEINNYIRHVSIFDLELERLFKAYRTHVTNIWDQTPEAAVYLLLGKALSNLKNMFYLAQKGSNHEVVELGRSAVESLELAFLFLEEKDNIELKKWFKGEIIGNSEARTLFDLRVNQYQKTVKQETLPVKDIMADIYDTYSTYTHSGYESLLNFIDPFYEDFDFKKYSQFHFTKRNLGVIENVITKLLLTFKNAFIRSLDEKHLVKIDQLLIKIGHANMSEAVIQKTMDPYYDK